MVNELPIGDILRLKVEKVEEQIFGDDTICEVMVLDIRYTLLALLVVAERYELKPFADRGLREYVRVFKHPISKNFELKEKYLNDIIAQTSDVVTSWAKERRLTGVLETEHDATKNKLIFTVKITW